MTERDDISNSHVSNVGEGIGGSDPETQSFEVYKGLKPLLNDQNNQIKIWFNECNRQ